MIYDPGDDLRSYNDDDCFVFTVSGRKITRSSSSFFSFLLLLFFFFFCSHHSLLSQSFNFFLQPFFFASATCYLLLAPRQVTRCLTTSQLLFPRTLYSRTLLSQNASFLSPFFFLRCGRRRKKFGEDEENTRN